MLKPVTLRTPFACLSCAQVSAGGALVDKRTGQPVYVANYESSVLDSGIMVARKGAAQGKQQGGGQLAPMEHMKH